MYVPSFLIYVCDPFFIYVFRTFLIYVRSSFFMYVFRSFVMYVFRSLVYCFVIYWFISLVGFMYCVRYVVISLGL